MAARRLARWDDTTAAFWLLVTDWHVKGRPLTGPLHHPEFAFAGARM